MKVPPLPESDFLNTKTTLCHIKLGAGGGRGGSLFSISAVLYFSFFWLITICEASNPYPTLF